MTVSMPRVKMALFVLTILSGILVCAPPDTMEPTVKPRSTNVNRARVSTMAPASISHQGTSVNV